MHNRWRSHTFSGWGYGLTSQPCHRAQRVIGVPREVVAWIDHDRLTGVLLLNDQCFTAGDAEAISDLLERGDYSAADVMAAFTTTGR
ncbi:hypothetical protein RVR_4389 [Actinacidiphila reveromycinica]|uniref:Uncharacterized protein n=1 Tax=Actinacidiphila reveromycinica TaxID=659352 RepID=A0A7U3VP17_9ACTN|nr:hypothetical protein RVR_4389 [Streptomyces sp. SN-593]